MMAETIVLGCKADLHTGAHGSLVDDPPPGFVYKVRPAEHVFLAAHTPPGKAQKFSPHQSFHRGEFVDFGPGEEIVHSSRWPVLNRRAWIVDSDGFGYPLLAGRNALDPDFQKAFAAGRADQQTRLRLRTMLAAYNHPSCTAILYRSRYGLQRTMEWLHQLTQEREREAFLAKAQVVYPAQKAVSTRVVRQKWQNDRPLRVVFCGTDFETKNGLLTLRILSRLVSDEAFGEKVHVSYIGQIPERFRSEFQQMLALIDYASTLPRQQVLGLLKQSHILFHPSKFESVGIVYLEAAAAAMAVITAAGAEMEHIGELFDPEGCLLVDRDSTAAADEEACFEQTLLSLIKQPQVARSMALHNHQTALAGRLSVSQRNHALTSVYQSALGRRAHQPLSLSGLPGFRESRLFGLAADDLKRCEREFLEKRSIRSQRHSFALPTERV